MRRPQFSIRTLFWLTLCVAMFFGGMLAQRKLAGIQTSEREKKQEKDIAHLRKQVQLYRQQLRTQARKAARRKEYDR